MILIKTSVPKLTILCIIIVVIMSHCRQKEGNQKQHAVYIDKKNEKYTLYKNGSPFEIKGAAGDTHLGILKNMGGNTIRTWDTTKLSILLDSAKKLNLSVIIGLPIANSDYISFYQNPLKITAQFKRFKTLVNKYKKHPAVLMWCVGNELDFPYKLSYNSFYKAFNQLTDMIHQDDPDHPVTTTISNLNKKYIFNVDMRCNIDVISFNIFSEIKTLRKDLQDISWLWNGPYLLTEWGSDGPWQGTEQTAWGAYIENTSTKKAEFYKKRYQNDIPFEDPRLLGAFVFFWGQKQETTPTWFSMFDEYGAMSEPVGIMKYLWTGKPFKQSFPQVKYMLVDQKGARDNIILPPNSASTAEVLMLNENKNIKYIKWEIFQEAWYKENKQNNTDKIIPLKNLVQTNSGSKTSFITPSEEGPYRIFATIYDKNGNYATCNTPFYVLNSK